MYDYKKMKSEMFEGDNASKHFKLYTSVVSICVRKVTFTIGDILNEVGGLVGKLCVVWSLWKSLAF